MKKLTLKQNNFLFKLYLLLPFFFAYIGYKFNIQLETSLEKINLLSYASRFFPLHNPPIWTSEWSATISIVICISWASVLFTTKDFWELKWVPLILIALELLPATLIPLAMVSVGIVILIKFFSHNPTTDLSKN